MYFLFYKCKEEFFLFEAPYLCAIFMYKIVLCCWVPIGVKMCAKTNYRLRCAHCSIEMEIKSIVYPSCVLGSVHRNVVKSILELY